MADFVQSLNDDLIEQFRGKPNIKAIIEVVGDQLQDVADFYYALKTERSISTAIGKQLDGAGDIVVLNRAEAGLLASISNPGEIVTDEVYRKYLIYKVLKNTNTCTYKDIINSFQMFWAKPLFYSEDPEQPATMIFHTDVLGPDDRPEDLLSAPIIRPAGVGVKVIAITETPEMSGHLYVTGLLGRGYTVTRLPELKQDYDFSITEHVGVVTNSISKTIMPDLED